MRTKMKKIQIIKCYIHEMAPQLQLLNFGDDLRAVAALKYGSTNTLNNTKLSKYIKFEPVNNTNLILDFSNSSIKDVYKGLSIISNNKIVA